MFRALLTVSPFRLVLVSVCFVGLVFGSLSLAGAQGRQRSRNTSAAQNSDSQGKPHRKSLTPLRSSDTSEGSRVTITADGPLNDYSAYRSGNRFYVVIPAADAPRATSGFRGRGFEEVQTQRRGENAVLSFRLQPGASAHVNQRFNKLDVEFTVPGGGTEPVARATPETPSRTPESRRPEANRNVTNQSTGGNTNAGQANTNQRSGANLNARNSQQANTAPTRSPENSAANLSLNQNSAIPSRASMLPSPAPSQSASVRPVATPASNQVAQTQPRGAPPSAVTAQQPGGGAGNSLGVALAENWLPLVLVAGLLLLIFGFIAARGRTSRPAPARPLAQKPGPALKAAPVRPVEVKKPVEAKKQAEKPVVPAKPAEPVTPPAAPVVTPEAEALAAAPAIPATPPPAAPVSTIAPAAEAVGAAIVAGAALEQPPAVEGETAPVVPTGKAIARVVADAADRAETEVKRLLGGKDYDEEVVGTHDAAARQIIASELLSSLAGRNQERRELARAAYVRYGYFDEAARSLRDASAPGERSSAARALSLVRDRAATPHLVAALHDNSPEVRRTAVEALADMGDPAALVPLEELLARETNRNVPRGLIQRAIEACRTPAPAKDEALAASVVAPVAEALSPAEPVEAAGPALPETLAAPAAVTEAAVEEAAIEEAEPAVPTAVTAEPEVARHEPVPEAAFPIDPIAEAPAAEIASARETAHDVVPTPAGEIRLEEAVTEPALTEDTIPALTLDTMPAVAMEPSPHVPEGPEPAAQIEAAAPEIVEEAAPPATAAVVAEETAADHVPATILPSDWREVDLSEPEIVRHAAPVRVAEPPPVPPVQTPVAPAVAEEPERVPIHVEATPAVEPELPFVPDVIPRDEGAVQVTGAQGRDGGAAAPAAETAREEKGIALSDLDERLGSEDAHSRMSALSDLSRVGGESAFQRITEAFDDPSVDVRNAAARALFELDPDRAGSFTRALREAPPERRRSIGTALAGSGLAGEAIGQLMSESREKTYDAFSLLFLMSKAGETQPLMRAIEDHPSNEVRLAVVKLLALSGRQEVLPAFRRLAVRGSLPTEVRSAVMEAIYQISNQPSSDASHTA